MWQVIFFGVIALFVAGLVYVQFFDRRTRRSNYDPASHELANYQIAQEQAKHLRDGGFGGPLP